MDYFSEMGFLISPGEVFNIVLISPASLIPFLTITEPFLKNRRFEYTLRHRNIWPHPETLYQKGYAQKGYAPGYAPEYAPGYAPLRIQNKPKSGP